VETSKSFEGAVEAVEKKTAEKGFRVLNTHDVAGALAEKGFAREPLKIVEVCNARYAAEALKKDVSVALMLPCPIAVYMKGVKVFISTMRPSALTEFYPKSGIEEIAQQVEQTVLQIIEEAK